MGNWFTIDSIDENTYIISEYRHWEETHCYLLIGSRRSLLIDTGLGISNIYDEVVRLTDRPVTAVATHIHWDHIGGHRYFPDFYAHAPELDWLSGGFPLPIETIRNMVIDRCDLPEGFDVSGYTFFQGTPTKVLTDRDVIDLGGRRVEALHTPGHSPGHLCFWEKETGYLFTAVPRPPLPGYSAGDPAPHARRVPAAEGGRAAPSRRRNLSIRGLGRVAVKTPRGQEGFSPTGKNPSCNPPKNRV